MGEYTYGPWIAHNGDECPVPPKTLVRVWLAGNEGASVALRAGELHWAGNNYLILVYQIATPVPEPVAGERVFYDDNGNTLWPWNDQFAKNRITLPTLDGKIVTCKCGQCKVEAL